MFTDDFSSSTCTDFFLESFLEAFGHFGWGNLCAELGSILSICSQGIFNSLVEWQRDTQRFPEEIFSEINKTLIKFIKLIKVFFFFPDSPSSSSQKITAKSYEQMNLLKLIGWIQRSPTKSWHGERAAERQRAQHSWAVAPATPDLQRVLLTSRDQTGPPAVNSSATSSVLPTCPDCPFWARGTQQRNFLRVAAEGVTLWWFVFHRGFLRAPVWKTHSFCLNRYLV